MLLPRLLQSLGALLLMSLLVFCLIGLMPGDPVDLMAAGNPEMTPEDVARLREYYGLDQPLLSRYGHWLAAAAQGDFGYSRLYGLPVLDVLGGRLLNSFVLLGLSLALTLAIAVPAAVFAAEKPGGWLDRVTGALSLAGLSLPSFWAGLLLIGLFAVTLGWLPAAASLDNPASLVLPVVTLTLGMLATYTRHLRAAMAEALSGEHIKTARAKGCGRARVLWRHAFPMALTPLVTLALLDLGALFGGALTVETVFAFPGMGKLLFDAVMGNDYNLALVGFFILTACVLAANLLADALYPWLDPRARKRDAP